MIAVNPLMSSSSLRDASVETVSSMQPSSTPPRGLLDLAVELLLSILTDSLLSARDVVTFGLTCHDAHVLLLSSDLLWSVLLQRFFPEDRQLHPSYYSDAQVSVSNPPTSTSSGNCKLMERFLECSQLRTIGSCPMACCGNTLLLRSDQRCPCVSVRYRLPLTFAQLHPRRSGSSSLKSGGFGSMRSSLATRFRSLSVGGLSLSSTLDIIDIMELSDESLRNIHVLLICTTEGPPISDTELAAMRRWVEAGGALIVSAFSNWSRYGHFARNAVGWLGIETEAGAPFGNRALHRINPPHDERASAASEAADAYHVLVRGAFGTVGTVYNIGEQVFHIRPSAFDHHDVRLLTNTYQGVELGQNTGVMAFYPPRDIERGGVTGRGRVLVVSNLHFLADPHHWNGGCFKEPHNDAEALLLNFVGSALTARGDDL